MILLPQAATATLPQVLRVRCHYCQRFKHPREVITFAAKFTRCWDCEKRHIDNMRALATGSMPSGCQVCLRTIDDMEAAANGDVRMVLVFKDGIYQLLCRPCAAEYQPKRRELYKGTPFGAKVLKI